VTVFSSRSKVRVGTRIHLCEGPRILCRPKKNCDFSAIAFSSVKTLADRYRHAAYHNKHW